MLAEIETDKATMEFEAFQDGVLLHIGVEKGATAAVDSILAILGEAGEDVSGLLAAEAAAPLGPKGPAPRPLHHPPQLQLLRPSRPARPRRPAPLR